MRTEYCPHPLIMLLGCVQTPVTMDEVLLVWQRGNSVRLARIEDGEGSWLCSSEVHRKLGSSSTEQSWSEHIQDGERTS